MPMPDLAIRNSWVLAIRNSWVAGGFHIPAQSDSSIFIPWRSAQLLRAACARPIPNVSKGIVDRITAEINIHLLNIKKMVRSTEVKPTLPIPRYDLESDVDGGPTEVAEFVRKAWYVPKGPIRNLTAYVEQAGIIVVPCDFTYANVDGVTMNVQDTPPCIFLNRNRPADRTRFSLAHELGHVVLHWQPTADMEEQANEFASALLMPAHEFMASCSRRIDLAELARLKMIWRVSMQAALYRIAALDLATKNQCHYLWRQLSALGYRKQEPPSTEITGEAPGVVPKMLDLHMGRLGYSLADMANLACLHESEFAAMYGLRQAAQRPRLRVVK
jgi:Zn-dependent peptidase ImmA (M78 family)